MDSPIHVQITKCSNLDMNWTVQYANVNLSHHVQVQKLIGHLDPNIGHKLDKLDIWTNLPTLVTVLSNEVGDNLG